LETLHKAHEVQTVNSVTGVGWLVPLNFGGNPFSSRSAASRRPNPVNPSILSKALLATHWGLRLPANADILRCLGE
jgi:hypothetical protein